MGAGFIVFTAVNSVLFILICLYFFNTYIFNRDPAREIPSGKKLVSPADGKVIDVMDIDGSDAGGIKIRKGLGKIYTLTKDVADRCYLISIFMNPLDVHVNRAPIEGKVEKVSYEKGKFFPVTHVKNGLINEKNEVLINHDEIGKIKVIQIAGFLARKIDCWVKEGQKVVKGQRIGKIKLGSQVTLIIPKSVNLKVSKGEKVQGGSTVIAEY